MLLFPVTFHDQRTTCCIWYIVLATHIIIQTCLDNWHDHLTLLNIYNVLQGISECEMWCYSINILIFKYLRWCYITHIFIFQFKLLFPTYHCDGVGFHHLTGRHQREVRYVGEHIHKRYNWDWYVDGPWQIPETGKWLKG